MNLEIETNNKLNDLVERLRHIDLDAEFDAYTNQKIEYQLNKLNYTISKLEYLTNKKSNYE
jgi:hypothetical protein